MAGALGGLLAGLISYKIKNQALYAIPGILIAIAVSPNSYLPKELVAKVEVENSLNEIASTNKLMSVIFKYKPEIRNEFADEIIKISLSKESKEKRKKKSIALGNRIIGELFNERAQYASDASLAKIIKADRDILTNLSVRPVLCVKYANKEVNKMTLDEISYLSRFNEILTNVKSDALKSSFENPISANSKPNIEEVITFLKDSYMENNYDIEILYKFFDSQNLSVNEKCKVSTSFLNNLISLGDKKGVYIYRNLFFD